MSTVALAATGCWLENQCIQLSTGEPTFGQENQPW
jgi:hypothetical protein